MSKGLNLEQFINIHKYVELNHRFASGYNNPNRTSKDFLNIKYIDSVFDTRSGDWWNITFRVGGQATSFNANDVPSSFNSFYDYIMDYLMNFEFKSYKNIKVGHIVKSTEESGFVLHCGSGMYKDAVVISETPFILTSRDSTMKWQATIKIEDFEIVSFADDDVLENCKRRLND